MRRLLIFGAMIFSALLSFAQTKPFPQAINYSGCIKPNHVSQASMNTSVASYYDYWKAAHLRNDLSSLPGGYYVKGNITGDPGGYTALGSSEGQGYGMVISVLMAGHDPNAKTIFDGLFKTARAFKSSSNPNLMGWVVADAKGAQGNFSSATDGDMDIAYALILAHYQWGSNGAINYLEEAKKMITNGLKASNVTTNNRLNLGDWDSKSALNTRPSDWMFSHMRAFYKETNDQTWLNVINNLYNVYGQVSNTYASSTGLISDFVVGDPARPAPEWYLNEFKETDEYNYNACRVPLRVAMDHALYGSGSAKNIAEKLTSWVKEKTGSNPANIRDGYQLNGTAIGSYATAVFVSPFIAASVTNSNNQAFLNSGWDWMKNKRESYYSDSYNLLCMLFISGNWWKPEGTTPPPPADQSPYEGIIRNIPGKIEAEHYDFGGEGVAYHDLTTSNQGNAFRDDAVDIELTSDAGEGYNVGWIQAGEWLEYTVNVTTAGTYSLQARVAAISSGKFFHVEMDEQHISGPITVPNTGSWQNWQTVTVTTNHLTVGKKIMRIVMDTDNFNINHLVFSSSGNNNPDPSPTVNLTSPANNTSFTAPASISISATASISSGNISKVEFYNGSNKLGEDASAPYSLFWNNVAAGNYTLTAKAISNQGIVTTSSANNITVISGSSGCSSPQYKENGGYSAGNLVQNTGNLYECKPYPYSGWCNGSAWAYAPGTGAYWQDAWVLKGACTTTLSNANRNTLTKEETTEPGGLFLYPNPSINGSNSLTISFEASQGASTQGDIKVEVISRDGVCLYNNSFKNVERTIELKLPPLKNGMYIIKVRGDGNNWTKKYFVY